MENENQEQRGPRLPKGRYAAKALSGELGNSSNKGTPQVVVDFKITEYDFAGERIPWIGYFTPATEERTLESLRIMGWKGDDLDNLEGITDNEVELVVDHESYEGKVRARVAFVNRAGGFQQKAPMNKDAAREFALRMRGKAAASRVAAGTGPAASSTPRSPVPTLGPDGKPLPF
jgi:hypothetical protein